MIKASATNPVSDKQAAFIGSLLTDRTGYSEGFAARVREGIDTDTMSAAKASEIIDWMLKLPKAPKATPTTASGEALEPGFWIGDADPEGIDVWKVQNTRDGERTYAKKLVVTVVLDDEGEEKKKGTFEYVPGGFATLARSNPRRFTLEEAQLYGKAYGVCARCGAHLEKADSVERMMGPVCYKKVVAGGFAL